jgi:hypothetical protein
MVKSAQLVYALPTGHFSRRKFLTVTNNGTTITTNNLVRWLMGCMTRTVRQALLVRTIRISIDAILHEFDTNISNRMLYGAKNSSTDAYDK